MFFLEKLVNFVGSYFLKKRNLKTVVTQQL